MSWGGRGPLIAWTVAVGAGYLVLFYLTQIIPITIHPNFEHDKNQDHSKNVQNYADLSLSGPPGLPPTPLPPLPPHCLCACASSLVTRPCPQLLCVIAIRRDGRGGSQIRA